MKDLHFIRLVGTFVRETLGIGSAVRFLLRIDNFEKAAVIP